MSIKIIEYVILVAIDQLNEKMMVRFSVFVSALNFVRISSFQVDWPEWSVLGISREHTNTQVESENSNKIETIYL